MIPITIYFLEELLLLENICDLCFQIKVDTTTAIHQDAQNARFQLGTLWLQGLTISSRQCKIWLETTSSKLYKFYIETYIYICMYVIYELNYNQPTTGYTYSTLRRSLDTKHQLHDT